MRSIVISIALLLSSNASWPNNRLSIGTLVDDLEPPNGRCSLQLPHDFANKEGRYIFVGDFDGHAKVNIDGQDIHLHFVKSKGSDLRQPGRLGQRSTYDYAADGLAVEVDYVVTAECRAQQRNCNTTRYDAILTIRRGKEHGTVAAKGVCGN